MKNLEAKIIEAAANIDGEFSSWQITKEIEKVYVKHWWQVIGYGTMINALGKLEKRGVLISRWEDNPYPENPKIPRRRLYKLV